MMNRTQIHYLRPETHLWPRFSGHLLSETAASGVGGLGESTVLHLEGLWGGLFQNSREVGARRLGFCGIAFVCLRRQRRRSRVVHRITTNLNKRGLWCDSHRLHASNVDLAHSEVTSVHRLLQHGSPDSALGLIPERASISPKMSIIAVNLFPPIFRNR